MQDTFHENVTLNFKNVTLKIRTSLNILSNIHIHKNWEWKMNDKVLFNNGKGQIFQKRELTKNLKKEYYTTRSSAYNIAATY